MKIHIYGTRGSIPVAGKQYSEFGGNTTCLMVESDFLPEEQALVIDTGSGFSQLSSQLIKKGIKKIECLYTHYHHDHTLGMTLAPHAFTPNCQISIIGPKEQNIGAKEVLQMLFKAPLFPVDFKNLAHKFSFYNLEHIGTEVIIYHKLGGRVILPTHEYQKILNKNEQIKFKKQKFSLHECVVISSYKTVHPEYTISYKIEEMYSGKIFVFLTDHECTLGLPLALKGHIKNADLLLGDSQYSQEKYLSQTAGYGHGTPNYCVELAHACAVKKLGLTHHDPLATDKDVLERLNEAQEHKNKIGYMGEVFACSDFMIVEV